MDTTTRHHPDTLADDIDWCVCPPNEPDGTFGIDPTCTVHN